MESSLLQVLKMYHSKIGHVRFSDPHCTPNDFWSSIQKVYQKMGVQNGPHFLTIQKLVRLPTQTTFNQENTGLTHYLDLHRIKIVISNS